MTDERDPAPGGRPEAGSAPAGRGAAAETPVRMRVAQVFDGSGPNGGVLIKRPAVGDAEFEALARYLTTAPVALATARTAQDEMSPDAGMTVPRAYHTDGYWIWPAAVGYYLHHYRLPPQPELVAHIRARGYQVGPVAEPLRQAAAAQMLEELAAARRRQRAAGPADGPAAGRGGTQPAAGAEASAAAADGSGTAAGREAIAQPALAPETLPDGPGPAVPDSPDSTDSPVTTDSPGSPVTTDSTGSAAAAAAAAASSGLWVPEPAGETAAPERQAAHEPEPAPGPVPAPKPAAPQPPAPEPATARIPKPAPEPFPAPGTAAESSPPSTGVLPVVSFSRALTEAGNRHAAWVLEQIEEFLGFMPVDEWSVDHASRLYQQAGRQFAVDALGRLTADGRWLWAWAEPTAWSADPRITERVRAVCRDGAESGIAECAAPVLDLSANTDADDPETAAEMLAWTVMGLSGARGYIGHSIGHSIGHNAGHDQGDQGRIYYLTFDESVPAARPRLGEVPRFLSQGVLKFEESAADCVLGYVEHYGWEWSRSADGIEVSAAGLGSFTADLSGDGALTGISLH